MDGFIILRKGLHMSYIVIPLIILLGILCKITHSKNLENREQKKKNTHDLNHELWDEYDQIYFS